MLQWEGEREQSRSISFSIGYFFILDIFVASLLFPLSGFISSSTSFRYGYSFVIKK